MNKKNSSDMLNFGVTSTSYFITVIVGNVKVSSEMLYFGETLTSYFKTVSFGNEFYVLLTLEYG